MMRYWLASFLVLAIACGDDSGDGDGAGRGRGSAACQDWQDAICDFAAGDCGIVDRATCDDNYHSISCNSDERASECANAFNDATCAAPPASCDLTDLVDRAPAQQACDELMSRWCAHIVECGMRDTQEACLQEVATVIDCSSAAGYTLGYEDCLASVDSLACAAAALPDGCDDVIRLLE